MDEQAQRGAIGALDPAEAVRLVKQLVDYQFNALSERAFVERDLQSLERPLRGTRAVSCRSRRACR